jgi:hypothetical protein
MFEVFTRLQACKNLKHYQEKRIACEPNLVDEQHLRRLCVNWVVRN